MDSATTIVQATVAADTAEGRAQPTSPGTMGAVVFFTVMAVIAVGAFLLYLKYRPRTRR
jgi:hypothetical protein